MTMLLTGAGMGAPGGSAPAQTLLLDETGLGTDVVHASSEAWRLTLNYTGALVRARRSSDSAQRDLPYGADNKLDVADLAAWAGSDDVFLVTRYDQGGAGNNLTQATAANQPKIMSAGVLLTGAGGLAETQFDGSNDYFRLSVALTQPVTVFTVFKPLTFTANDGIYDGFTNVSMLFAQSGSGSPNYIIYAGTASANKSFTVNTPALCTAVFNGASSVFGKNDDAESAESIGTAAPNGLTLGGRGGLTFFGNFGCQEWVIYSAVKDATARATAKANYQERYSIW